MQDCPIWGSFQHDSGKLKGWSHERLALALLDHVARDYAVMVDSSKTAWTSLLMPFRLAARSAIISCWSILCATRAALPGR